MAHPIEAGHAKLIWRPTGQTPGADDFDAPGVPSWSDGAEAIRQAGAQQLSGQQAGEPWIKVGETIYSPDQIRVLRSAEAQQANKDDEGMPGDEPWE